MGNPVPHSLKGYFNEKGILQLWPAKGHSDKRTIALEWLASHFELDVSYHEREVNTILKGIHSFGDHAFLRRELVDRGYLVRDSLGTDYRRIGTLPCIEIE